MRAGEGSHALCFLPASGRSVFGLCVWYCLRINPSLSSYVSFMCKMNAYLFHHIIQVK